MRDGYQYRKRPAVIRAVRNMGEWPPIMNIETLEGVMRCDVGDWLICGVKGELYPCKPDVFAATYEEVRDD